MSIRWERAISATLKLFIAMFVIAGFATAARASVHKVRPELVVETCSFATALLLLAVEQRTSGLAERRTAIRHATEELVASARILCEGPVVIDRQSLLIEKEEIESGLRYYYPHLATAALKAALVGGAMDNKHDSECVAALGGWLASAETCNTRFAMAELLLFFLPSSEEAMHERLQLHVAIVAGPAADQRHALEDLVGSLTTFQNEGLLPVESGEHLQQIKDIMQAFARADAIADEIEALV
jgi:hypothetical protein